MAVINSNRNLCQDQSNTRISVNSKGVVVVWRDWIDHKWAYMHKKNNIVNEYFIYNQVASGSMIYLFNL